MCSPVLTFFSSALPRRPYICHLDTAQNVSSRIRLLLFHVTRTRHAGAQACAWYTFRNNFHEHRRKVAHLSMALLIFCRRTARNACDRVLVVQIARAKLEIIDKCKRGINACLHGMPPSNGAWRLLNGQTVNEQHLVAVSVRR